MLHGGGAPFLNMSRGVEESNDSHEPWDMSYCSADDSDVFDGTMMDAKDINKKLMRLSVDARAFRKHSIMSFDSSEPVEAFCGGWEFICSSPTDVFKEHRIFNSNTSRFPRIEDMAHFHYNYVDFLGPLVVTLNESKLDLDENSMTTCLLTIGVSCAGHNWLLKRTYQDIIDFDRQTHVCLYDRRYSCLPALSVDDLLHLNANDRWSRLSNYFRRFSMIAGSNINCGPVLNWLELDNHGNHLVVMEADDSAINVPAVAAARVNKRYVAQARDELSLEVGDFVSVIDMPPSEETVWWRGKKQLEVGFFPSHCVELLGTDLQDGQWHYRDRPVINRRGKVVSFLRFFFKARPTKEELMQSGILRERMFGCDLGEHLNKTGVRVPLVLKMCSRVIEKHGIVDGIYRLSGITSNMQKLRVAFDNDELPNLSDSRFLNDIHCISSLLKTYFRELPNPLMTYELYDKFVVAMSKEDDTERTVSFHHVIQRLPPPHYRTLEYLLKHLSMVARHSSQTNMNEKNLAIVWAPNLLRPNLEEFGTAALAAIRTQAIIVEYLLKNVDVFFDTNLASSTIAFYPEIASNGKRIDNPGVAVNVTNGRDTAPHPKLISLHEARQRALRKEDIQVVPGTVTDLLSEERNEAKGNLVPQYHDQFVAQPTQPVTKPVSPGPNLVSLEEARARTRTRSIVLSSRKGSVDLAELRNKSASAGGRYAPPPTKRRTWKSLFSRKNADDEVMGVNDNENAVVSTYRRRDNGDILSLSHSSTLQDSGVWRLRHDADSQTDGVATMPGNLLQRTHSSPAGSPSGNLRSPFTRQEVFRTSGRGTKRSPKVDSISSDGSSISSSSSSSCVTPPPLRRMQERINTAERPNSTPGQSRRFDRLAELLKENGKSIDSSDDEPPSPDTPAAQPFVDKTNVATDDEEQPPVDSRGGSDDVAEHLPALSSVDQQEKITHGTTNDSTSVRDALLLRGQREIELLERDNDEDNDDSPSASSSAKSSSLSLKHRPDNNNEAFDWLPVMQRSLNECKTTNDEREVSETKSESFPFPIEYVTETAILDDFSEEEDSADDFPRPPSFYDNRRPSFYDNLD